MDWLDLLPGVIGGSIGGSIVAVVNHVLTKTRWEREHSLRERDLELKAGELDAKYGAGVRTKAVESLYEKLSAYRTAGRWVLFSAEIVSYLDSVEGHHLPPEIREGLSAILESAEKDAVKADPERALVSHYEEYEQEQSERLLADAPPEVLAEMRVARIRVDAMDRARKLLSESLLKQQGWIKP